MLRRQVDFVERARARRKGEDTCFFPDSANFCLAPATTVRLLWKKGASAASTPAKGEKGKKNWQIPFAKRKGGKLKNILARR